MLGGGGGSVANMGFVSLYRRGLWIFTLYNYVTCRNVMGRLVVCHVGAWGAV